MYTIVNYLSLCDVRQYVYLPIFRMNMKQKDILIVLASIITIGILRLFISIPNFTPIGALALTGGYFLGKRSLAFLLPLGGLLISDIVLGLSSQSNWDYLFSSSFALVGSVFIHKRSFEFNLHIIIRSKCKTRLWFSCSIKFYQITSNVFNFLFGIVFFSKTNN